MTRDQANKIAEKILSYSTFPDCDIRMSNTERAFIRFAVNGITTSGLTEEQSVIIASMRDGRSGMIVLDQLDDRSLREAVQQTEQLASLSPPNPEQMPSLEKQKYVTEENVPASTAAARNAVMIPQIRAVVEAAKGKGLVAAGFFERITETAAIASKRGNFGWGRMTDARLTTTIRNPAGTSSGWASQPSVRIEEIDGGALARAAIDKCVRWQDPKRLEPGKYTVVLEPTAVSDLLGMAMTNSMAARAAEEGRSFFSRKGGGSLLGEKLFPEYITLRSEPFHALYSAMPWTRAFLLASIDSTGLPAERRTWIENGVVKNLFYDRYWASKAGVPAQSMPTHLVLEGTEKGLGDLIESVERGLLVTRFFYVRPVNMQTGQMTGLTRDGLFLIEKGKITTPVVNFRWNESRWRMLQNTVGLGKPQRVRGMEGSGMITPPLVVKDFPFTSVSDAV